MMVVVVAVADFVVAIVCVLHSGVKNHSQRCTVVVVRRGSDDDDDVLLLRGDRTILTVCAHSVGVVYYWPSSVCYRTKQTSVERRRGEMSVVVAWDSHHHCTGHTALQFRLIEECRNWNDVCCVSWSFSVAAAAYRRRRQHYRDHLIFPRTMSLGD